VARKDDDEVTVRVLGPSETGTETETPRTRDDREQFEAIADPTFTARYAVKHVLGRGGMGTVYLAADRTLGREVALKLHRAGSGNDRLLREAIAMAKLQHPNVVTVFEVATADDRLYVAMEYVRGETLRAWMTRPHGWRDSVDMLVDAGKGLAAAHAAGLVHRDFKPENVLVGEDGRPRVSDFGLVRLDSHPEEVMITPPPGTTSVDTPMTTTNSLMGTPAYMAPELIEGGLADARSDQFAFCVVAWECLFGKRPFAGTTLATLALAAERGDFQLPPKSDVPSGVRTAIERGLAMDPDDRHADMPALLVALRDAATRRARRRAVLAGAALGLVGIGVIAATAASSTTRDSNVCEVGAADLAGAWDGDVKTKVHASLAATGVKSAAEIATRLDAALDDYSGAWLAMRKTACEATRVRGEQSETLLDARMDCLDRKRDELRALTQNLADADKPAAMGAVRAGLGLTPIATCADVAALTAPVRPPADAIRDQVAAERRELATVKALRLLGRIKQAAARVDAIAPRAKAIGYRPLEAEVLLVQGDLIDRAGDTAKGVAAVEQAIVAAEAGNHRLVAAEAWSNLAWMVGSEQRKFDRADFAVSMAAAAIEKLGGNPELHSQLVNYEALILETKGKGEAAKAKYLEALAERDKIDNGHDTWQLSIVLNDLGGIERQLGDYAASRSHHERALAIRRKLFGERHPYVVSSLINLGNVAWSKHDYPAAEARFKEALTVADDVFPENHPQRALAIANLASTYEKQAKYDAAVQEYRRSLAIYEATRGPDAPDTAEALHNLANSLVESDKLDDARKTYERALTIVDKPDAADDPALVPLLYDYADLLLQAKDYAKAEPLLQRAVAIGTKANADDPDLANPLTALGELLAATNRAHDALLILEHAIKLRTGDAVLPEEIARTELALAKLLWPSIETRNRARDLIRSARQHVEHAAPSWRDLVADIAKFDREHPQN